MLNQKQIVGCVAVGRNEVLLLLAGAQGKRRIQGLRFPQVLHTDSGTSRPPSFLWHPPKFLISGIITAKPASPRQLVTHRVSCLALRTQALELCILAPEPEDLPHTHGTVNSQARIILGRDYECSL